MFDQLQTASFIGGFNASIRNNMPAMSHYISTGMEPFAAVFTAMEVMLHMVDLPVCNYCIGCDFTCTSGWESEPRSLNQSQVL